ncbi:MAG: mercuric transporter MerT family protein [Alphaproteobacteria bacterium]|nr:mercuric transporter MerT family protein [Pseudomonadota bacterium]
MKEKLLAAGGVLGALAASTCCIGPLLLVSIGVSGAWIGNLAALAPYQPIFLGVAVACLGAGFWLAYRRKKHACETGSCASSHGFIKSFLWVKGILWLGTVLVALSVGVDFGARLFL